MEVYLVWALLLVVLVKGTENGEGVCDSDAEQCEQQLPKDEEWRTSRYSQHAPMASLEDWGTVLKRIDNAVEKYREREHQLEKLGDGNCSLYDEVIEQDLQRFKKNGVSKKMIEAARNGGLGSLYQVQDGKLYREKSCKFPARCSGIEHFLREIAKDLPNMEFVVNTSDWPQVPANLPEPLPVFSFSKTKGYADIRYPAWAFWEGGPAISLYPKGIGRWDVQRKGLLNAAKEYPWESKEQKAFFRGSRTSTERDELIYLSITDPGLVDARYTKNQAWKSDADTLNLPPATEVSFEEHCKFKYLFNYRGVAASFRFKHLFLCNSLVFHVGNEWTEFFYDELKPWVHYIPVNPAASKDEIRQLIEFAKENDHIAQAIADRGFNFIQSHLKMEHITCYWKRLLLKYSELLQ